MGSPSWDPLDEEGPGPDGPGGAWGWVASEHVCRGGWRVLGTALPGDWGTPAWQCGRPVRRMADGPVLSKPDLVSCVGLTLNTEMPHFKCRC